MAQSNLRKLHKIKVGGRQGYVLKKGGKHPNDYEYSGVTSGGKKIYVKISKDIVRGIFPRQTLVRAKSANEAQSVARRKARQMGFTIFKIDSVSLSPTSKQVGKRKDGTRGYWVRYRVRRK